jgi:glycosyltransferase involved in cell wall biosynthesis
MQNPLPVTVVFAWFTNKIGGLEQLIITRSRWFRAQGVRVIIITVDGPMLGAYEATGAELIIFGRFENDFDALGASGLKAKIQRIASLIRNPDGYVGLVGYDKKSVWFLNEIAIADGKGKCRLVAEYVALKIFYDFTTDELAMLGESGRIICLNQAAADFLAKTQGVHLGAEFIIPIPVPQAKSEAAASYSADAPVVISACRLDEMKEYVFGLLRGSRDFFQRFPAGRIIIIGDGVHRQELEKIAAPFGPGVVFGGSVDPTKYGDVISCGTVFVGMGTAAVQAAQRGLPVVLATAYDSSFSSPGYLSAQASGNFGEDTGSDLAQGWTLVLDLLRTPEGWQRESRRCAQHAENVFSYECNMRRFAELLGAVSAVPCMLRPPSSPSRSRLRLIAKAFLIRIGIK